MTGFLYRMLRIATALARFRMSLPTLQARNDRFSLFSFQRRMLEELEQPLSFASVLTGDAMAPTFNEGLSRTEKGDTVISPLSI